MYFNSASNMDSEQPPAPSRTSCKLKSHLNINTFLRMREFGLKRQIGYGDQFAALVLSNLNKYQLSTQSVYNPRKCGGIFNMEYSLDGRLLLAACEKSCVLIYDSHNQKIMKTIERAHNSCVNCIRFIDERVFATCSDDNTIKLWDIRQLKNGVLKTLYGHANWVKNIECSPRENMMVTSAFDGSIYAWNLKSPTENSVLYDKVFTMNGLMRTKLSPDGSKMLISTTGGYMIIVHDLNLGSLSNDFKSFKPLLYRLMQTSGQSFPAGTIFNHLFYPVGKHNRVEFIDDFTFDAEVISSLQIHPHGWCAVSRSVSRNETEEVTSVHDIQTRDSSEYESCVHILDDSEENNSERTSDSEEDRHQAPTDLWMGYISNHHYTPSERGRQPTLNSINRPVMGIISTGLIGYNAYANYFNEYPEDRNKVVGNLPRLTHYIEEQNVGKGFIKELCFSPDGRVICSPYNRGIRLLGFSENYEELSHCVPSEPRKLKTLVEMNNYHSDIVVSCKFNPNSSQLVSGCLNGEIVWYKPVL